MKPEEQQSILVIALYAAFAMNNLRGFHATSGQGYALLAAVIQALNTTNPQIGARMLAPLREWRRYTPDRQLMMQKVLQGLMHYRVINTMIQV